VRDHDHDDGHEHDHEHSLEWPEAARIALVAIAAAAVWFRVWEPLPSFSLIGVVGHAAQMVARRAIGGYESAIQCSRQRRERIKYHLYSVLLAVDPAGIWIAAGYDRKLDRRVTVFLLKEGLAKRRQ
jgi:hypothetical protein